MMNMKADLKRALIFAFIAALASIAAVALAATLNFSWNNATLNTDGSAIPASGPGALESTTVVYGSCNGSAFGTELARVTVPASQLTTVTPDLPPGTYCGYAMHLNNYGVPSDPSNIATKTIPAPKPNAPRNFTFG